MSPMLLAPHSLFKPTSHMMSFEFKLMTAGHKQLKHKFLMARRAVFPTLGTVGVYTGFLKSIAHKEVPRSRPMAQPGGLRSKGMKIRAGEYKWMIKSMTRV